MTTPRFSVLTAVYDPTPDHLAACLASVARQHGPTFEHVLVDDASTDPRIAELLGLRAIRRTVNGGIVAASNDALAAAAGEWVVLLDHDDVLADGALARLAKAIDADPTATVVYSDHDQIRPDGRHADPAYKPDFSPERLRQHNWITHLVAVRRAALVDAGGFRPGTDGAQDHDALLRLMESGATFVHVPEILAHWRQSPASVATDTGNKPTAFLNGLEVVRAHLARSGIEARVSAGTHAGTYRIRRHVARDERVSVVVPTRGSQGVVWGCRRTFVVDAVASLTRSSHAALEFVVVADADTPPDVLVDLERIAGDAAMPIELVRYDEPFHFSRKVNAGVAAATADTLLILNDDTELIDRDSVTAMLGLLHSGSRGAPGYGDVGAVGAKLLYADGTLQHGGHVYHGEFMHALLGYPGEHPGPGRMLAVEREVAGVTAAALMTTRAVFDAAGGFPDDLPLHFNDVDFCLAVRALGHRIVWTPHASWYHFEGKSRSRGATLEEWNRVAGRWWPDSQPHDPYSNPNLTLKRDDWLELPGRSGAPPYYYDASGTKRWS
ncbi:MAG TPA: glycosyltransferase [Ilumatobacter sp.]|nr:glycosyltransferase [Ilumatobacter sp.]